jgi:hypothetical protein
VFATTEVIKVITQRTKCRGRSDEWRVMTDSGSRWSSGTLHRRVVMTLKKQSDA